MFLERFGGCQCFADFIPSSVGGGAARWKICCFRTFCPIWRLIPAWLRSILAYLCSTWGAVDPTWNFLYLVLRFVVEKDKYFRRTLKPLFTDKASAHNKIVLEENDNTMNDDKMVCEIFDSCFLNITDILSIMALPESDIEVSSTIDNVEAPSYLHWKRYLVNLRA